MGFNSGFKGLTEIPNCAANGFVEMGVGRQSRRGECMGELVKCWYRMTCLDPEQTGGGRQRDEWQKSNNECEKLD